MSWTNTPPTYPITWLKCKEFGWLRICLRLMPLGSLLSSLLRKGASRLKGPVWARSLSNLMKWRPQASESCLGLALSCSPRILLMRKTVLTPSSSNWEISYQPYQKTWLRRSIWTLNVTLTTVSTCTTFLSSESKTSQRLATNAKKKSFLSSILMMPWECECQKSGKDCSSMPWTKSTSTPESQSTFTPFTTSSPWLQTENFQITGWLTELKRSLWRLRLISLQRRPRALGSMRNPTPWPKILLRTLSQRNLTLSRKSILHFI